MKIKKLRYLYILFIPAIVVLVIIQLHKEYFKHKTPPPGFGIVCDMNGHYAAIMPHGTIILGYDDKPYSDRQGAINRAWSQYEYELRLQKTPQPETNYTWYNCDN